VIWTTWRQHRAEALVAAGVLAALVAALLVVGKVARNRADALGLSDCGDHCSRVFGALHRDFHSLPPFTSALIAIPLLAGMFWAAPLVSREYEAGTHRLAWTQSVSPLRWLAVKIALIFGSVAAAALLLGLLADWTLTPLTDAFGGAYNSTWYDIRGIVPVACMLFALALGVAASALTRRTIPAMAVTLVGYAAARIPIHWIRWHFAPLQSRAATVQLSSLLDNLTVAPHDLGSALAPAGAAVHGIAATGPSGHPVPADQSILLLVQQYCPGLQVDPHRTGVVDPDSCAARLHGLALHVTAQYQSASHFWLVQAVESAVFVATAALLVAGALTVVSRRPG
jgi:hypothetical protein